jgi:hypothetical protein
MTDLVSYIGNDYFRSVRNDENDANGARAKRVVRGAVQWPQTNPGVARTRGAGERAPSGEEHGEREREERKVRTLVISVVIRSISRSSAVRSVKPGRAWRACSLSSAPTVDANKRSGVCERGSGGGGSQSSSSECGVPSSRTASQMKWR